MSKSAFSSREQFSHRLVGGLYSGLLAGSLLGFVEAWAVLAKNWETLDFSILPYATTLYLLIGIAMGCGVGVGLGLIAVIIKRERTRAQVVSFVTPLLLFVNMVVIGRYRIFRDIMKEKPIPLWGNVALVFGSLALCCLLYLVLRAAFTRTALAFIPTFSGTIGVTAALLVVALACYFVFTHLKHRSIPPVHYKAEAITPEKPNVILIMIDALRADYLGAYGNTQGLSPNLDALASESIVFERAYAQASWTKASSATLFTGLYPSTHQTFRKPDILPDSVVTLAEVLAQEGYYTIGYANNINISPTFNFQQGFHEYHYMAPDYFFYASAASSQLAYYGVLRLVREKYIFKDKKVNHYYQDAKTLNAEVLDWLSKANDKGRFYMYLHYMEPHDPYFIHPYNGVGYARVSMPNPAPSWVKPFKEAYAMEVRYVDDHLGLLFQRLKSQGLYDDAMIIITADHGEEFYEHQGWWHGTTLYNEQIQVPLMIKLPKAEQRGTRISGLARLLDVAPTILNRAHIAVPEALQGIALLPVGADVATSTTVFSEEDFEGNIIKALITPDWKLIRANDHNPRGLPTAELFDLQLDPHEQENLYAQRHGKVQELDFLLKEHIEKAFATMVTREQVNLDEAVREQMENLGYVSGGRSNDDQADEPEPELPSTEDLE